MFPRFQSSCPHIWRMSLFELLLRFQLKPFRADKDAADEATPRQNKRENDEVAWRDTSRHRNHWYAIIVLFYLIYKTSELPTESVSCAWIAAYQLRSVCATNRCEKEICHIGNGEPFAQPICIYVNAWKFRV